jgi:hypothetical protein
MGNNALAYIFHVLLVNALMLSCTDAGAVFQALPVLMNMGRLFTVTK